MNAMLLNVLLISGGAHLLALFVLGSITVYKYIIPDEAQFEEPPAVIEEQPPPEVKIEIKPQAAPQDQSMRNFRMKQVGTTAVNAVNVTLPTMQDSFTVSAEIGGFGGGSLLGGSRGNIGIGMSDISVFGLKTRAERILFVIDANRHMVTDKKGGLNSYKVIKDEITDMVGNLSVGTLFNVMIVDRRANKLFKPQLVPAGEEVHQQLIAWMRPINADANNPGLEGASGASQGQTTYLADDPIRKDIEQKGMPGNDTAFVTQLAMEQQADAIFFITGYHRGFERIHRRMTEREKADWESIVSNSRYQAQLAKHQLEGPIMRERINRELAEINAKREAKGEPPRVLENRHHIYSQSSELGLKWETPHPGFGPIYFNDPDAIEKYFKDLVDVIYIDKGSVKPSVNVILFLAGDEEMRKEWEDSLDDYTNFFRGKYRIIRGLDEIKSARSAAETTN